MDAVSDGFVSGSETRTISAVTDRQYAITVRHAQIQYIDVLRSLMSGKKPSTHVVLQDFNMTVQKGHIYGLLGASGCGKTSILRAIVGQHGLAAGNIRVLSHEPKSPGSGIPGTTVGYMPQDLCLLDWLTIKETLYYYGILGGMKAEQTYEQCNYLVKLLDLPKSSRIVGTLSGGQQRRVSFAIALLHSPPVLILDEPTVGVDPLLRESIWEYLNKLVKTNDTTVLITTHYIQEAAQADVVGLMRNGKLMAEENPRLLMQLLRCSDLEEVLYKLCLLQSSQTQSSSTANEALELAVLPQVKEEDVSGEMASWCSKNVASAQKLRALLWKDVLSLFRHYAFLFPVLFIPMLVVVLFCSVIGVPPKDINIIVFNQEANCSSRFAEYNNSVNCDQPARFSCRILELLQEKEIPYRIVAADSEQNAEYQVRRGRAWASMTFEKNFTSALMERANYMSLYDADDSVIDMGSIRVAIDFSNRVISFYVQQDIFFSLKKVLHEVDDACHNLKHMKELPFKYNPPVYGTKKNEYLDCAIPGIIAGSGLMFPLTLTLSTLLPDKMHGTLERSLVTGVTMTEVVISQFFANLGPVIFNLVTLILTPYVIFQLEMIGSFWTMFVVLGSLAMSGMTLGFILGTFCTTMTAASVVATGIFFTCLFVSGMLWPVEGAYQHMQWLSWSLPMTLPTSAIRAVAQRGWGLGAKTSQMALACTTMWTIAFVAVLLILFRLKR